jgi:hypothetical protein
MGVYIERLRQYNKWNMRKLRITRDQQTDLQIERRNIVLDIANVDEIINNVETHKRNKQRRPQPPFKYQNPSTPKKPSPFTKISTLPRHKRIKVQYNLSKYLVNNNYIWVPDLLRNDTTIHRSMIRTTEDILRLWMRINTILVPLPGKWSPYDEYFQSKITDKNILIVTPWVLHNDQTVKRAIHNTFQELEEYDPTLPPSTQFKILVRRLPSTPTLRGVHYTDAAKRPRSTTPMHIYAATTTTTRTTPPLTRSTARRNEQVANEQHGDTTNDTEDRPDDENTNEPYSPVTSTTDTPSNHQLNDTIASDNHAASEEVEQYTAETHDETAQQAQVITIDDTLEEITNEQRQQEVIQPDNPLSVTPIVPLPNRERDRANEPPPYDPLAHTATAQHQSSPTGIDEELMPHNDYRMVYDPEMDDDYGDDYNKHDDDSYCDGDDYYGSQPRWTLHGQLSDYYEQGPRIFWSGLAAEVEALY